MCVRAIHKPRPPTLPQRSLPPVHWSGMGPEDSRGRPWQEPEDIRNSEQRERQRKLREADRQARKPGRDDVARLALYWLITRAIEKEQHEELEKFRNRMVEMLTEQGFDPGQSETVLGELIYKYGTTGSPFRRKVHLLFSKDEQDAPSGHALALPADDAASTRPLPDDA